MNGERAAHPAAEPDPGGAPPGPKDSVPAEAARGFDELLAHARSLARRAYAPYSRFRVGAAARTADGRIVGGCNVENAGYGVTLCAECGLVSELVADGGGRLAAFVCVGGDDEAVIMPCGRCRQLLAEHAAPDLVILTPRGERGFDDVLPQAFGPRSLEEGRSDD